MYSTDSSKLENIQMLLTDQQADQICDLLKDRNELTRHYSRVEILSAEYRCRFSGAEVIACVELKKVQWYQSEVRHLAVALKHERQGHAKALIQEVERQAILDHSRLLQCTIRESNVNSRMFFEHQGFRVVNQFHNQVSQNNVYVLQKTLVSAT